MRFRKEYGVQNPHGNSEMSFFISSPSVCVLVLFVTPSDERTLRCLRESCNGVEREHRRGYATPLRQESEKCERAGRPGESGPANPAAFLANGRRVGETLSQSNASVRRTHGVICQSVFCNHARKLKVGGRVERLIVKSSNKRN